MGPVFRSAGPRWPGGRGGPQFALGRKGSGWYPEVLPPAADRVLEIGAMTHRRLVLLIGALIMLCAGHAHAQLSMTWTTIDGGGGSCSGGFFTLDCTIGQPDAGPVM